MGLRTPLTIEERDNYCQTILERHRQITSVAGGSIFILDIENYRKNEKALSQIGWIEVHYRRGAWGSVECRVVSVKHYVVTEHRPKTIRQSPLAPVQERTIPQIQRELKARFDILTSSGLRTLFLAHAADNDLKCLENVFGVPMWLFRSSEEFPDRVPPFEILDTQTFFANVLGIQKSVRLCLAIWVMRLPSLGFSCNSGNFHCPLADCHYTFAVYLRLIEALTFEYGR